MKTRWGSCNPRTKKLWFSVGLVEKPDECIEYVVLHELAHSEDCQSRCGLQSLFVAVYAGLASAPKAAERTLNQHVLLF